MLLPTWAMGQEALGPQGDSASPYVRNWRDRFTPFQDPMGTKPARLDRPLSVPLPPDLLRADAPAQDEWACATRQQAAGPGSAPWALQTLQADQTGHNAQPLVLRLPIAIRLALCHNPQVRASWSAIAQQAAQVGQAQSAYWPQLNAGIGRQRSRLGYAGSEAPASTTSATTQNLVLSWRLWDFGARSARTSSAQAHLLASLHTQDATVLKVLSDVLHTYGEAQAAQARLHTQRTLLPLAERSVQAAQRRQQGGAGSGNDTLQAAAAQARIQLELSRSEGEVDKTTSQLAYLLGLPPGTAFGLDAIAPEPVQRQQPGSAADDVLARSLDQWLEQARQGHPAIQAAKAQWEAAQASLKAAQSEGLPTLDFTLAHYRNGRPNMAVTGSQSRENVVGIHLNIPLFDGFNTTYKVRAAQALVEQKAIEYQTTEQQIGQELVQLHAEAKASLKNLQSAQGLYAIAGEAAASMQRQYEKGAADIVQLNQNLMNMQQAQMELSRSQAEWNRSRLKLILMQTTHRESQINDEID
ncbi:MAG: TolC family protein [Pseudomonadota bacterium]|nr:TolC family protein [Pseudomonadota bacterium]